MVASREAMMNNPLDPRIAFPLALIMMLIMLGIWYIYVRPVPEMSVTGVIISRQFLPAQTVERSVPRLMRSLEYMPRHTRYSLPDRYVYQIRMDRAGIEAMYTSPTGNEAEYEVGRRVKLVYQERYIPLRGRRIFVKEMRAIDEGQRSTVP